MKKAIIIAGSERFREGLYLILRRNKDIEMPGKSADYNGFREMFDRNKPDLILVDTSIPGCVEAVDYALKDNPEVKVIAFSDNDNTVTCHKLMMAGVKCFLSGKSGKLELEHSVNEVLNGRSYFSDTLLKSLFIEPSNAIENEIALSLTGQEREIIRMTAENMSIAEMAAKLKINASLMNSYHSELFSKAACRNSASLVLFAVRNKLLEV